MRSFNTAGPCDPVRNYMLPAVPRLPEAPRLVAGGHYFVVHAPRQTGKTTTLRALARQLTAGGEVCAVHFSCEQAEPALDDYEAAELAVLSAMREDAQLAGLAPELLPPDPWPQASAGSQVRTALRAWAELCPRPLVLFFDEIDALRGEGLRSILRQLRAGFPNRPHAFPASVILCGLRDVRDYKAASGGDPTRLGTASPFNIKVESIRLGDFSETDVRDLYAQHTSETGQEFTDAALHRAWTYTQGQPWLVNALAREIIEKIDITPPVPITAEHVDEAKNRLILARATHLDSLAAKLQEPRVRRVIEPIMAGALPETDTAYDDDMTYIRDLGLVAIGRPVRIANPIYQEVITRILSVRAEDIIDVDPRSFVAPDGKLDIERIVTEFAAFWRLDGELISEGASYHEVAAQLVLMAYLQRVVNGGGTITREFGLGRRRIDILIRWPYTTDSGKRAEQHEAIELKVWAPGRSDPLPEGLSQLDAYLERLDLDHGTLVIFDRRREARPVEQRVHIEHTKSTAGRPVLLLRA